jgi:hypothetical protein
VTFGGARKVFEVRIVRLQHTLVAPWLHDVAIHVAAWYRYKLMRDRAEAVPPGHCPHEEVWIRVFLKCSGSGLVISMGLEVLHRVSSSCTRWYAIATTATATTQKLTADPHAKTADPDQVDILQANRDHSLLHTPPQFATR